MTDEGRATGTEMTRTDELERHVGRLVAFARGRWYEVLAVGPVVADERSVTVPAPRHGVLQRPVPPGRIMEIKVFAADEFPVRDAPTDPAERAELTSRGHHLVRPPEKTNPEEAS